jgi:hypothetical protein
VKCPACRHDNPPESRFCTRCGHGFAGAGGTRRRALLRRTIGITAVASLALVVAIQIGVWPLDGPWSAERSSRRAPSTGPLEYEGRVRKVEPVTRTLQLSSGILGLGTMTFSLSDETRILVAEKEGGLGDLRPGVRVRVVLDLPPHPRVARVIELLVGGGGGQRPPASPESPVNVETSPVRGHESVLPRAASVAEPRPTPAADRAQPESGSRTDPDPPQPPPTAPRAASPAAVTRSPAEAPTHPPSGGAATASRHSGTVVEVGSDRLVVAELGLAGKEERLHITVTPATRVIESVRNPRATSFGDQFTTTPITLMDVRKGDHVVIDARREGNALVARSLTVTLRSGER